MSRLAEVNIYHRDRQNVLHHASISEFVLLTDPFAGDILESSLTIEGDRSTDNVAEAGDEQAFKFWREQGAIGKLHNIV